MSSNLLRLFLNRFFLFAIAWLAVQQMIVASSNIWITNLARSIQLDGTFTLWLTLYLGSLLVPYLPGMLALVNVVKAQVTATTECMQRFSEMYAGRIFEWTDHSNKERKTAVLSGESSRIIEDCYNYLYHVISTFFSVSFNLTIISIIIDIRFTYFYIIGTLLVLALLKSQDRVKSRLSTKAYQSRIKLTLVLLNAWDNVLINNVYNLNVWKHRANSRFSRYIGKYVILEKFSQLVSISMALTLMLPSFALVIYLFHSHLHDLVYLAMLTVVLPRLFLILSYSYDLLFLLSELPRRREGIKVISQVFEIQDPSEEHSLHRLSERIQWDQINVFDVKNERSISTHDLIRSLPESGRYLLNGKNGSGKTSLLLLLKAHHGQRAFYLPTRHNLSFRRISMKQSTGQQVKSILNELALLVSVPIILLDEWDANLDVKNREEISELINTLAQRFCIIESRHGAKTR